MRRTLLFILALLLFMGIVGWAVAQKFGYSRLLAENSPQSLFPSPDSPADTVANVPNPPATEPASSRAFSQTADARQQPGELEVPREVPFPKEAIAAHSVFPLEGGHANVSCSACHNNGVYQGTDTTCVACHTPPPNHYTGQCSSCHTTATFSGATFNHTFPINHEGANGQCTVCHSDGDTTSYTCTACHDQREMREEHNDEGISDITNCVACHANGKESDRDDGGGNRDNGGGDRDDDGGGGGDDEHGGGGNDHGDDDRGDDGDRNEHGDSGGKGSGDDDD